MLCNQVTVADGFDGSKLLNQVKKCILCTIQLLSSIDPVCQIVGTGDGMIVTVPDEDCQGCQGQWSDPNGAICLLESVGE